jgi:hypothetical protein
VFNKYQASLDNQLYKALKAHKESQEWRLTNLSTEAALVPTDSLEPS